MSCMQISELGKSSVSRFDVEPLVIEMRRSRENPKACSQLPYWLVIHRVCVSSLCFLALHTFNVFRVQGLYYPTRCSI